MNSHPKKKMRTNVTSIADVQTAHMHCANERCRLERHIVVCVPTDLSIIQTYQAIVDYFDSKGRWA